MKKIPFIALLGIVITWAFTACNDDNESNWEEYREWREANNSWLDEMKSLIDPETGELFYQTVTPVYDNTSWVLMHWYNDRSATADNLVPLYTSTVDVKYIGRTYDDEAFDSSYLNTTYGDSIYRTSLGNVINGWGIALQQMHVGDSVDVIIPYALAYGTSGSSSINPYSNLKFSIKLVDIPYYQTPK